MHILLIEDDRQLAEGVGKTLRQLGYAVDWIANGARADSLLQTEHVDLLLLDLGLPEMEGLEVLRRLRNRGARTPVLILTARGALDSRVTGLDLGADDYLVKPFELQELEARVRALLRRTSRANAASIEFGPLCLDCSARRVTLNGEALNLPRRELCLLEILLHREGQVVNKNRIADQLFNFDDEAGPNAIELYVHRLRKKLAPAGLNIRTIRGLGYLLEK